MSKITPNVLVADPKATNGKMGKPVLTKGIELNKGIAQLKLNVDSIRTSSKSSAFNIVIINNEYVDERQPQHQRSR